MAPSHEEYGDENELRGPVTHIYHQSKNGNGNGGLSSILLGLCSALLLILVAISGFMWRSQIDFQREMTERMATVETKLDLR